jgi:hypothetical protein
VSGEAAAFIAVGLLLSAAVAWFAAEQHYENCVETARTEVEAGDAYSPEQVEQALTGKPLRDRIDGCSRLPW